MAAVRQGIRAEPSSNGRSGSDMTSSMLPGLPERQPPSAAGTDNPAGELERLRTENRQLLRAIASHAVVDQAIGVLVVLGQITPQDGFTVLRTVSQHTNTKLSQIAEHIVKHAQGVELAGPVLAALHAALHAVRTGPE
ncbi:ANTAR domain-containing protein [Streptomyces sp. NPDC094038]|uniref:ANTAR domain-containing protein n=1 Tax=Streptomyces sp. NPDC094038 TaxID=3366055 RepID=UPI003821874D